MSQNEATLESRRFFVTTVSQPTNERSDLQNVKLLSFRDDVDDNVEASLNGSISSSGNIDKLGTTDETSLALSVPASLNYSYGLTNSQQLDTIAAAPSLQYLDTIMESSEYVDTTQGSVLLARAARMIAKDKSKHSLLFNSTHVKQMRIDCYRRLICIGTALLCIFASFQGLRNIQSSLPEYDYTLGLITFGCLRSLSWLGAIIARPIMSKISPKWTLVLSVVVMVFYPLSNFYRTAFTLIPSALLTGLGNGMVFSATNVYMLHLSAKYALLSMRELTDVVGRFNGVIMVLFHSSHLLGNFCLSIILSDDINWFQSSTAKAEQPPISLNFKNSTKDLVCGLNFYTSEQEVFNTHNADERQYYLTFAVFSLLAFIALLLCVFLKPLQTKSTKESLLVIMKQFVVILFNPRIALLALPSSTFLGLAVSITAGDFNKMFISCAYGIEYIGYISMAAACCSMTAAFLSARLIYRVGRIPVFFTATAAATGSYMLMLLWQPSTGPIEVVAFLPVMLWGVADGILLNQVMGYLSEMFRTDVTYALATHHFYYGLGSFFGTFASAFQWFSLTQMLYLALAHTWIAFVLFVCLQLLYKYKILQ